MSASLLCLLIALPKCVQVHELVSAATFSPREAGSPLTRESCDHWSIISEFAALFVVMQQVLPAALPRLLSAHLAFCRSRQTDTSACACAAGAAAGNMSEEGRKGFAVLLALASFPCSAFMLMRAEADCEQ